jgi:DNA-binding NarL/FixJ family response regulator
MDRLTPTQRDTLARACQGLSNDQIAEAVYREWTSVRNRLNAVYRKLGIADVPNPRVVACVALAVEAASEGEDGDRHA